MARIWQVPKVFVEGKGEGRQAGKKDDAVLNQAATQIDGNYGYGPLESEQGSRNFTKGVKDTDEAEA